MLVQELPLWMYEICRAAFYLFWHFHTAPQVIFYLYRMSGRTIGVLSAGARYSLRKMHYLLDSSTVVQKRSLRKSRTIAWILIFSIFFFPPCTDKLKYGYWYLINCYWESKREKKKKPHTYTQKKTELERMWGRINNVLEITIKMNCPYGKRSLKIRSINSCSITLSDNYYSRWNWPSCQVVIPR